MHSKEELWKLSLPELVNETLPEAPAPGEDYRAMASVILRARIAIDAVSEVAAASRSASRAARWAAIAAVLMIVATLIIAAATFFPDALEAPRPERARGS